MFLSLGAISRAFGPHYAAFCALKRESARPGRSLSRVLDYSWATAYLYYALFEVTIYLPDQV